MYGPAMPSEPSYLAVDPGETTGWATFDEKGELLLMGQVKQIEFNKFFVKMLKDSSLKRVIIEEYRNYGWKQQKRWSTNQTSKNIGGLEMVCDSYDIPYTRQAASCKPAGYKWAGLEQPSNHSISHQFDAVAHGVYWLQENGIRPVGLNLRRQNEMRKD